MISIEDFFKLDIRVGEIVEAENVANSNKLIKLKVNFGELGNRTILTGMAKWYKPEDFLNKKSLFIVNLEPRKMANETSEGMMLSVDNVDEERPNLIFVEKTSINGSKIS